MTAIERAKEIMNAGAASLEESRVAAERAVAWAQIALAEAEVAKAAAYAVAIELSRQMFMKLGDGHE